VPLIRLAALRWALAGVIPAFDPIRSGGFRTTLGDHETAHGRQCPCDLVERESGFNPADGAYRKGATFAAHDG